MAVPFGVYVIRLPHSGTTVSRRVSAAEEAEHPARSPRSTGYRIRNWKDGLRMIIRGQRSTAFLMHRCKCLLWVREWKNPVTALLRISTSFKIVAKRPLSSTTCYAKQLHYTHYVTRDCLASRS